MASAARTLGEAFPGRFVLGIGVSHEGAGSWHGPAYGRPLDELSRYLDAVDQSHWGGPRPDPPVPRMIAALGPKMLELTRRRSRGAIPYLVPVRHTAMARAALGADPVLRSAPSDRPRSATRARLRPGARPRGALPRGAELPEKLPALRLHRARLRRRLAVTG